jgi:protein SEY1
MLTFFHSFEDRFRYDEHGVPRIWRPSDDIDGYYSRARDATLQLIPLISRFTLSETAAPPPLETWIGPRPTGLSHAEEEELVPIGGVDDDAEATLSDETRILSDARASDASTRFRKTADGVYVEAKRGALGGVSTTPLWMWVLLLILGQNEIIAVIRNPFLLMFAVMVTAGLYITYQMNLWGPIIHMTTAAYKQGLEIAKERLRAFLLSQEAGRRAVEMEGRSFGGGGGGGSAATTPDEGIKLENLNPNGTKARSGSNNKTTAQHPGASGNIWDEDE